MLGREGAAGTAGLEGDNHLWRGRALFQLCEAFDNLDLVLLHQISDAGVQLARRRPGALHDRVEVELPPSP